MGAEALGASYRDPSGFVYTRDGALYRQVNRVFQERYKAFLDSGLYAELVEGRLLVRHREVSLDLAAEFRKHFEDGDPNADVPPLVGLGVMTDGDQTKTESTGDYADFVFSY